jgi:hypothetical protein
MGHPPRLTRVRMTSGGPYDLSRISFWKFAAIQGFVPVISEIKQADRNLVAKDVIMVTSRNDTFVLRGVLMHSCCGLNAAPEWGFRRSCL